MEHELNFINQFVGQFFEIWMSQLEEDSPSVLVNVLLARVSSLWVLHKLMPVSNDELNTEDLIVKHTSLDEMSVHDVVLVSMSLLKVLLELLVNSDFEILRRDLSAKSALMLGLELPLDALAAEVVATRHLAWLNHDFLANAALMVLLNHVHTEDLGWSGDNCFAHILRGLSLGLLFNNLFWLALGDNLWLLLSLGLFGLHEFLGHLFGILLHFFHFSKSVLVNLGFRFHCNLLIW